MHSKTLTKLKGLSSRLAAPLFLLSMSVAILAGESTAADSNQAVSTAPKLVVQITVDQLRGDLPMRFRERLEAGGFRYLMEQGTHYTNAHYRHANTETAVGHSTLVTGADPSSHGIVSNDWFDQKTGKRVYNTEDDRHHLIGKEPKSIRAFRHATCWRAPSAMNWCCQTRDSHASSASPARTGARSCRAGTPARPSGTRKARDSSSPAHLIRRIPAMGCQLECEQTD